jgi:hypothetical protein
LEDTVHLQGIRVSVKTIIPEDRLSFNSFHVVRERSTDFSHTQLISCPALMIAYQKHTIPELPFTAIT